MIRKMFRSVGPNGQHYLVWVKSKQSPSFTSGWWFTASCICGYTAGASTEAVAVKALKINHVSKEATV